jgi:hypothetical protein
MSLKSWLENRWIEAHRASAEEIGKLLTVVERDLRDAAVAGISSDLKGNLAYEAARQLAIVALHAEGYRTGRDRAHERAILSMQFTVGASKETLNFLDLARRKRNSAQYGQAGGTSAKEAAEILTVALSLQSAVMAWMKKKHPGLLEEP